MQEQHIACDATVAVTCVPLVQSRGMLHGLPMLAASTLHLLLPPECGPGLTWEVMRLKC